MSDLRSSHRSRPSGEACVAVQGDPEESVGGPAAGLRVGVLSEGWAYQ